MSWDAVPDTGWRDVVPIPEWDGSNRRIDMTTPHRACGLFCLHALWVDFLYMIPTFYQQPQQEDVLKLTVLRQRDPARQWNFSQNAVCSCSACRKVSP